MLFAKVFLATCLLLWCYGDASADKDANWGGCGAEFSYAETKDVPEYTYCFRCTEAASAKMKRVTEESSKKEISSWTVVKCDESFKAKSYKRYKDKNLKLLSPDKGGPSLMDAFGGWKP